MLNYYSDLNLYGSADDIPSANTAPTAVITTNATGIAGQPQTLSGANSSDPENDTLTYSWSLDTPAGSSATLSSTSGVSVSYTPDVAGSYVANLTVDDGELDDSTSETVAISEAPDVTPPEINIVPSTLVYNLTVGDTFTLPVATITDNKDDPRVVQPSTNEYVDAVGGPYEIIWTGQDAAENEAVPVTVTVNVADVVDTTPPNITLLGGNVTLSVGETYVEPGYEAIDNKDGDITSDVVVTGSTDTSAPRVGTLSYNVVDEAGNPAITKTRTFTVVTANEFVNDVASAEFQISDHLVTAYAKRTNRTPLKFKVISESTNIEKDLFGNFDFTENGVNKVEVYAGTKMIDSSTNVVSWSGSQLSIELGALDLPTGNYSLTIVIYIDPDDKGIVIAGPGLESNVVASFMTLVA